MKIGAHLSIGRGLRRLAQEAVELRCECLQMFVSNPRSWRRGRAPAAEEVAALREALQRHHIAPLICHSSYLVNLASPQAELWRKSLASALVDIGRTVVFGGDCFVVSGGFLRGGEERQGRRRMAQGLRELAAAAPGVAVLVENTAGAGSSFCWRFEELGAVLEEAGDAPALGVCLDTCHAHVAGYDLGDGERMNKTLEHFDGTVGLRRLRAMHLNDARYAAGSRRDAHAHIGKGTIGSGAFRALLAHPALAQVPGIIETPKHADADQRNLRLLRRLRTEAQHARARQS